MVCIPVGACVQEELVPKEEKDPAGHATHIMAEEDAYEGERKNPAEQEVVNTRATIVSSRCSWSMSAKSPFK